MAGIDGFTQCVSNAFQKYVETGDFFTLASEWSDCNMNYFKELQQGGVAGPFADFSALFQLLNAHSLVLFEALSVPERIPRGEASILLRRLCSSRFDDDQAWKERFSLL